ncbi:sulfotransferase ssu-1-like [Dermacentor variabilis]|uniref:sulfotransferase ssu-1-like n=1 Tax=Dermacentor variabilis TaxID=34621 RepID=UPI003F5AF104
MAIRRHPKYVEIEGLRLTSEFSPEPVRQALQFVPRAGDVMLVTYPKCGTHWVQQILQLIVNRGRSAENFFEWLARTPLLELLGTRILEDASEPRLMKTHLPLARLTLRDEARYVYVARNPWDCCVSFYHHTKALPAAYFSEGTFDDFFELFISGQTDHGGFFDHLLPWYARRRQNNVLFITYEQLYKQQCDTVLKIARFLGPEYEQALLQDQEFFQTVLDKSSAKFMKKQFVLDPAILKSIIERDPNALPDELKNLYGKVFVAPLREANTVNFVRKGVVGDSRGTFTREQLERMKLFIEKETARSDVMQLWLDEDPLRM